MPPNHAPLPPSGHHDPYAFITDDRAKGPGRLTGGLQGKSKNQRIKLAAIGGAVLLALIIIFSILLSGGGTSNKQTMIDIAQSQNEIIRVTTLGTTKSKDLNVLAYITTVQASMQTSQQQTISYLNSQKIKTPVKVLSATKNSQTDNTLKAADLAGTYDQALVTTVEKSVSDYANQLNTDYKTVSSPSQKKLIAQLFQVAKALQKNQPATN